MRCTTDQNIHFVNNTNTTDTGKTRRKLAYDCANVFLCGHQPFATHARGVHATLCATYATSQPSRLACIDLTAPGSTKTRDIKKGCTYSVFRFTKASKAPDGIDWMLLRERSLCNAHIQPRVRAHTPPGQRCCSCVQYMHPFTQHHSLVTVYLHDVKHHATRPHDAFF